MKKIIPFLIALTFCAKAGAQNVGIGTALPQARLHVTDSSVVFTATGTVPPTQGNPPISGPGRRMMWYAPKAAFRAGYVSGDHWNKDSIGRYSMALGFNVKALGENAIALGSFAEAMYGNSTAIGPGALANNYGTTAIGFQPEARGAYSTALGYNTVARGQYSIAMGNTTETSGQMSTAMGHNTNAYGESSTAMGRNTTASGDYSTAIGYYTTASQNISTAMGYGSEATGYYSTATGRATIAAGESSVAMGYLVHSNAYCGLAIGVYNNPIVTPQSSATSTTPLFIIGNGNDGASRSNAMVVRKDGRVGLGTDIPASNLHILQTGSTPGLTLENDVDGNKWRLYSASGDDNLTFYNNSNTEVADIDNNSGAFNALSDSRFKKEIEPLQSVLHLLLKLEPKHYHFNWQRPDDQKEIGMLAQETQKLFPSLVTYDGEKDIYKMNYAGFSTVAIKAIQEQQEIIDKQQAFIEEQKNINARLQQKIKAIERLLSKTTQKN